MVNFKMILTYSEIDKLRVAASVLRRVNSSGVTRTLNCLKRGCCFLFMRSPCLPYIMGGGKLSRPFTLIILLTSPRISFMMGDVRPATNQNSIFPVGTKTFAGLFVSGGVLFNYVTL